MKSCPKCNSQYDDNVVFCTRDGSPLKSAATATLRTPGLTLGAGRGSALGAAPLRAPGVTRGGAALAVAPPPVDLGDPTPADGLTREVAIPPPDDVVPGSEQDPYADSPTAAVTAPPVMVSRAPDGPLRTERAPQRPRPMPTTGEIADTAPPGDETPVRGTLGAPATNPGGSEDEEYQEPDLSGQVVAERYRVIRRLGEGGMGVVYQAIDERLEKAVAIKVLKEDFSKRQDVVARFTQEAKSAARIKHENVLDVTDYGKTRDGRYYIAMELLVGTDLADVLQRGEEVTVERAVEIGVQICRALAAAHALGVVHRDMKPENVFLLRTSDGRENVKIVDFGIAQMKDPAGENTRKLTRTGMIFGTPEYMSPEQASGKQTDNRVDVYATGVILYEMFAGRVPFQGDTFMGVLTQHMFEPPPSIVEVNPATTISAPMAAVIQKALSKDPNQRYASMTEFSDDLMRVRQGLMPLAAGEVATPLLRGATPAPAAVRTEGVVPVGTREMSAVPRRSSAPLVAAALLFVVGAVALVYALQTAPASHPPLVPTPTPVRAPVVVTTPTPTPTPAPTPAPVPVPAVHVPPPAVPARVSLEVVTSPAGARVQIEAASGSGAPVECTTPCREEVASGVPLRITATRGQRRGMVLVTPTASTGSITVALEGGRGQRPPTAPSGAPRGAPGDSHAAPCGPSTISADGLLVPCFRQPNGS